MTLGENFHLKSILIYGFYDEWLFLRLFRKKIEHCTVEGLFWVSFFLASLNRLPMVLFLSFFLSIVAWRCSCFLFWVEADGWWVLLFLMCFGAWHCVQGCYLFEKVLLSLIAILGYRDICLENITGSRTWLIFSRYQIIITIKLDNLREHKWLRTWWSKWETVVFQRNVN